MKSTCLLSININKIATLRNARGGNVPDVLQCAKDLVVFGAQGITVHPRPDERHIRKTDVHELAAWLKKHNKSRHQPIEFNIEGYPSRDYLNLIKKTRPHQATLVPDAPDVITSNAGWALARNKKFLIKTTRQLQSYGVRVSLFVDVFAWNKKEFLALQEIRPERIELYTERFARDFTNLKKRQQTTLRYAAVAKAVAELGIKINAGHDLSLKNVGYLLKSVPEIGECSIGHALISEALYFGFEKTVRQYRKNMMRKISR